MQLPGSGDLHCKGGIRRRKSLFPNGCYGRHGPIALQTPVALQSRAQALNTGQQTAVNHALDGDVILAAQALSLNTPIVVATANPGHLSRFVPAELWSNIQP